MKLFSCWCVFLLIIGLLAVIKPGVGHIKCHETDECKGTASKSDHINCLKNAQERPLGCPVGLEYCMRVTAKAEGALLTIKSCANNARDCDVFKTQNANIMENINCTTCSSGDYCNSVENESSPEITNPSPEVKHLTCYQNKNAENCFSLLRELRAKHWDSDFSETEMDEYRKDVIKCMKESHEMFDIVTCDQTRKCNKLDVKFQNEDKMSFKFCDIDDDGAVCELAKNLLKSNFEYRQLDYASCDYCKTDKCNLDSKEFICYATHFDELCMLQMYILVIAARDRMGKVNILKSEALNCWEREETVNLAPCTEDVCSTLTLNFKDGTQVMHKGCDFVDHRICEFKKQLLETEYTDLLSDAHCDFCSESRCNKALKGSSRPGESSSNNLTCWVTQLEFMCEIELIKWYKAQGDRDTLRSQALECLKGNQSEVFVRCGEKNSHCSKLILNFNDGDKTVFKFCDSKSLCQNFKTHLENNFKVELKSVECQCVDGCNSEPNELSPEITDPEAKQNKTRSRSSGSCIYLSVYALFSIVGAFSI